MLSFGIRIHEMKKINNKKKNPILEKEEGVQFQTFQGMNGKTGVHGVKPISRMQCKPCDIIINMIYYVVASSRRVFKTSLGFYFCPVCVCVCVCVWVWVSSLFQNSSRYSIL